MTKTIITQSWLATNGFAGGTWTDAEGKEFRQYSNQDMVFEFGASNWPVLRRKIGNGQFEYLGGYETWEEAMSAFIESKLPETEFELRGNRLFKPGTYNTVADISVQRNFELNSFHKITDVESNMYANLFTQSPKLYKWAMRRLEAMEKAHAAGLLDEYCFTEYEELKAIKKLILHIKDLQNDSKSEI